MRRNGIIILYGLKDPIFIGELIMNYKKIAALIAVSCLVLSLGVFFTPSVSAVEETYDMSDEYKSSKYYQNFKSVTLSGDQASDVIAIALSQLGYHEGDSNADLGGSNLGGTRDFVEYNVLYGKIDNGQGNGKSYGYYWCASFVNWCLRQARVSPSDSAAAEVSCQRWLKKCQQYGMYKEKGDCIPSEGDLIFFKDKGSNVPSTHMGLVLYSDGETVFTVEGNTSNDEFFSSDGNYVALKSYPLDSDYIVGYATPDYAGKNSAEAVDRAPFGKSVGSYISTDKIEIKKGGETIATVNEFELLEVLEIDADGFEVRYEKDGEIFKGVADLTDKAIQIRADNEGFKVVELLDSNGERIMNTLYIREENVAKLPEAVPEKEGLDFVAWLDASGERLDAGDTPTLKDGKATLTAVWEISTDEYAWNIEDTIFVATTATPAVLLISASIFLIIFNKKRANKK